MFFTGTLTSCANAPSAFIIPNTVLLRQWVGSPFLHAGHFIRLVYERHVLFISAVTLFPISLGSESSPISTTSPVNSCPRTNGKGTL